MQDAILNVHQALCIDEDMRSNYYLNQFVKDTDTEHIEELQLYLFEETVEHT